MLLATRTEPRPSASPISEEVTGETEDCYIDDPIVNADTADRSEDASPHDTSGLLWLLDDDHEEENDNTDNDECEDEQGPDYIDTASLSTSSFSSLSSDE